MARIFVARSKSYNNSKSLYPTCLIEKKRSFRHFVRSFAPAAPIFITTPVRRPSRQFPIFAIARHKE